jgi:hydroxypyruvate reductase
MKQVLAAAFASALRELAPGARVRDALRASRADLTSVQRIAIVAMGKAARPMAAAALDELRELAPRADVAGLCVPPEPDDAPLAPLDVIAGGHPLPTQGSFGAARRALAVCEAADAHTLVLFLVSGGASSLCELPLDAAASVTTWREFYRALVGSGAGIEDINAVRSAASATKGGKLAHAARRAHLQWTLAISDVPGSSIAALGSGPSIAGSFSREGLERALAHEGLRAASLLARDAIALGASADCAQPANAVRALATTLLDNATATEAAARAIAAHGYRVRVVNTFDEAPSDDAARSLLAELRSDAASHRQPVAIVAGGEVRVALPQRAGSGGRNQHFALQCAEAIAGEPIAVLSCGTDGIDGNSQAAGGVVDGSTTTRAHALGLDVAASLAAFDSSTLLAALGDTIVTGPTGTNVRDLRILLCHAPTQLHAR